MKTQIRSQNRITRIDVAALLAFLAVWAFYIWIIRYGFCYADESYYVTIAQRLVHGDRLIVDEWPPPQLACLWAWLPYKLYVAVNGNADGIILFMRFLFLAANAVFYWTMYALLRAYRWTALIATLLFSLYVPLLFFACNYYSMSVRLLMIVCLLLFFGKQKPASLVLSGVLLACAVLYQPFFAFVYFAYSALVLIRFFRLKKGKRFLDDFDFCLHMRGWKYVTVSVIVCAAVFLGWLLRRNGLRDTLDALPYFFSNPDVDFSSQSGITTAFFHRLGQVIDIYGLVCLIPALVIAGLSIAYALGAFRKRRDTARKVLFCLACINWILSCVRSVRIFTLPEPDVFFTMYPATMFWFGFVCYLLCEHKNKRFLPFWCVGLISSLCIDFSSQTVLSVGCPIAYIADLVFFVDLVRELRADQPAKKIATTSQLHARKRAEKARIAVRLSAALTCICFAVWVAFLFTFNHTAFPDRLLFGTPLSSLKYVCTQGPWRSLRVSPDIGEIYAQRLADIDTIKETQPKNLYVCGVVPELYLYADLPYATYCSETYREKVYIDRQIEYWKLHPDRMPACIYVPIHDLDRPHNDDEYTPEGILSWIRSTFDPLCTYTAEQGQGGYILYVSQWHLPEG